MENTKLSRLVCKIVILVDNTEVGFEIRLLFEDMDKRMNNSKFDFVPYRKNIS